VELTPRAGSLVWVDALEAGHATSVAGAKMGRLADVHRAGVRVPRGFVVTTDSYRRHCVDAGLDARIDEVIAALGPSPSGMAVDEASAEVRSLFAATPMLDALGAEIAAGYEELCRRCGAVDLPTAVRSSAIGEDGVDASFAGVFDTYLGVSGAARVLAAVRSCWASLFTARALSYRSRRGISHREMPIAVGVLELVPARASGVAFSLHPVTGDRDRVVIEGSWGLGEAVVQGRVDPDHIEVGKSDRRLLAYHVAHKTVVTELDAATGRSRETNMPPELADRRVLDDEEIDAITEAVTTVERHCGEPVDVEWVIPRHRRPGESVYVVQSRPVTAATRQPPPGAAYDASALARKYVFGARGTAG
jgi:pyruvate,water dikinase